MVFPWLGPGPLSKRRIWAARGVAALADVVQVGFAPFLIEGALSPIDDVLDGVMCITLTMLIGWHIAFLPSFLVKLTPFADMAPTWTIAVLIATAGKGKTEVEPADTLPPGEPKFVESKLIDSK